MKLKIDEKGFLHIERAGKWSNQVCPFAPLFTRSDVEQLRAPCGDWCPHFGTPFDVTLLGPSKPRRAWQLNLCHGKEWVGDLVDERGPS